MFDSGREFPSQHDDNSPGAFQVLVGHEDAVHCCAIADDERIVVSGAADKMVMIWEVGTGDTLHTLDGHKESTISAVAVTSDGTVAFSGTARLLDNTFHYDKSYFQLYITFYNESSYTSDFKSGLYVIKRLESEIDRIV